MTASSIHFQRGNILALGLSAYIHSAATHLLDVFDQKIASLSDPMVLVECHTGTLALHLELVS